MYMILTIELSGLKLVFAVRAAAFNLKKIRI